MKDEIKEILDRLKRLCYDNYCLEFSVDYIERKEEKLLLDYITNLQEENKLLKISKLEKQFPDLNAIEVEIDTYKSRCEKAVEYIKNNICDIEFMKKEYGNHLTDFELDTTFNDIENLLNILERTDKE